LALEHLDPWKGIILPYINFAIFLGLAIFLFRKPFANMALKRHEQFNKSSGEAAQAHEKALAQAEELRQRLSLLDKDIDNLKTRSRELAEIEAKELVSDAARLAQHLREEARRIADAEMEHARFSFRRDMVEFVRKSVEDKIRRDLSPDAQLAMIRRRTEELGNMPEHTHGS
jgi:F0F1-type ATP synthase membrane subunit b/b'